jgi:hypothetical protein
VLRTLSSLFVALLFAVVASPSALSAELPVPGAPHYTTNPEVCLKNGGGSAECSKLNGGRAVAFYWSWNCTGRDCSIAGFHLRHATGPRSPVLTRLGSDPTLVDSSGKPNLVESEPGNGWGGACYVVTAYRTPVQNLVDLGGGAVHSTGTPSGSYAESMPSPKICIGPTSQEATINANKVRGFNRSYTFRFSDSQTKVETLPPLTSAPVNIGFEFFAQRGVYQLNQFFRVGFSFDLAAVGENGILGGTFAYDMRSGDSCVDAFQAPAGWDSSSWPVASGAPLPGKAKYAGSTMSIPIDEIVQKWPRKKPFAVLLQENQRAEDFQGGQPAGLSPCFGQLTNPRLILKVGTTV